MPFNFRLNVQNVFRRLGIQTGARLPQLNDAIQMTMLVTDLSKLVPAPIEPRAMAGANIAGVNNRKSVVQLQSLASGGIFVETIVLRSTTLSNTQNYLIDVSLTDLGMPALPTQINIGGTPAFSRFTGGVVITPTGGATLPAVGGGGSVNISPGIFVPNQAFVSITTTTFQERLDVAIFYRELPSVEEVG